MIFIRITLWCLFLLLNSYNAQATETDEIAQIYASINLGYWQEAENQLQLLKNTTDSDDIYTSTVIGGVEGYLKLQNYATKTVPDKTLQESRTLLTWALKEAEKYLWFDLAARFALYLGQLEELQANFKEAFENFKKVQTHFKEAQTSLKEASENFKKAQIHFKEAQGKLQEAQDYYEKAKDYAEQSSEPSLVISSLCSLAKLALVKENFTEAWEKLQQAKSSLENSTIDKESNSQLWLSLGYQALQLYQKNTLKNALKNQSAQLAFESLQQALTNAKQNHQLKIQAFSLNYLARLYQLQDKKPQAIQLLENAVNIIYQEPDDEIADFSKVKNFFQNENEPVENVSCEKFNQTLKPNSYILSDNENDILTQSENLTDILINLEWQLAELYKTNLEIKKVCSLYKLAIKRLQNSRIDIPVTYQNGNSSFKEIFQPLYLGYADLLLQQATLTQTEQKQGLLKEAQKMIEFMKQAELEDYFQSRCELPSKPIKLKAQDKAAALYPIALQDRLEILVETSSGLQQFTTSSVVAQTLETAADEFSKALRSGHQDDESKVKQHAEQFYQWMIKPIKEWLEKQAIETLVYIPDGKLRLIPLAALNDGDKYVVEDYAVVTLASLYLPEIKLNTEKNQTMLLAGLSEPGEVIKKLQPSFINALDLSDKKQGGMQRSRDLKLKKRGEIAVSRNPTAEELRNRLKLPEVEDEIKQLHTQNNTLPYLLNETFSLERFEDSALTQTYSRMHIASHGFFGSTEQESFVMTHNKLLTITELKNLLNQEHFKQHPLDLITFSACQTAQGDDKSPLGMSGIAIQSKVRSALGSLWSVSDGGTSELMKYFYKNWLKKDSNHLNKAKALQEAQKKMIAGSPFTRPVYWSPFILIGDWR